VSGGFRILRVTDPGEKAEWIALHERWPDREPAAHPDYASLLAEGEGEVVCAVWEDDGGVVLFPLVLRSLGAESWLRDDAVFHGLTDLTSPYGYGGPFRWGRPDQAAFWTAVDAWAVEVKAVSLFTRLSLFPDLRAEFDGTVKRIATNVVRDLRNPETIWMDYRSKVRRNVKRARAEGVEVVADLSGEHLHDFARIYAATMDRHDAEERLRFTPHFFQDIRDRLGSMVAFFHAVYEGRVVSSELVLVARRHLYFFLGGTETEAFPLRPNDMLKHAVIEWGAQEGKEAYVLGGAYRGGGGLLGYKQSFAPSGDVPFEVGQKIFDPDAYEALTKRRSEWNRQRGRPGLESASDFFPAYRT